MRDKIAQYLTYDPRNKLIFAPSLDQHLHSVDVGFELSKGIETVLTSKHLAMIAEDYVNSILRRAIKPDEIIGDYIAIENWGILFEPALNLNLVSIFTLQMNLFRNSISLSMPNLQVSTALTPVLN